MRLPLYQVDAFTSRVFAGNPAAVCPLDEWLDDATLPAVRVRSVHSGVVDVTREGDRLVLDFPARLAAGELRGGRVRLGGHAVRYLAGTIEI